MRRFAEAVIAVTLLGGCVNYNASKVGVVAGAGLLGGGVVLASTEDLQLGPVGTGLAAIGVLVGLTGLIGVWAYDDPADAAATAEARDAQLRAEAETAQRARAKRIEQERIQRGNREQAFILLKTATQAARSGDCASAIRVEAEIRVLDAGVHDAWFMRDVDIKACLAAASSNEQ